MRSALLGTCTGQSGIPAPNKGPHTEEELELFGAAQSCSQRSGVALSSSDQRRGVHPGHQREQWCPSPRGLGAALYVLVPRYRASLRTSAQPQAVCRPGVRRPPRVGDQGHWQSVKMTDLDTPRSHLFYCYKWRHFL